MLQKPFNGLYILACFEKVFMQNAEQKGFKSKFGRRAKKDFMAYLELQVKREAELEGSTRVPTRTLPSRSSLKDFLSCRSRKSLIPKRTPQWTPPMSQQGRRTYHGVRWLARQRQRHSMCQWKPMLQKAFHRRGIWGKSRTYRKLSGRGIGYQG